MKSAHYDSYNYPAYWLKRDYEHSSEVLALREFLKFIPKFRKVIDVGAGFGRLTPYYGFRSKRIVLLDPSKKLLSEAKSRLENNRETYHLEKKKIEYVAGKVEDLKKTFTKSEFDLALMVRVMHHVTEPGEPIKALSSIIAPGGYLILEFANKIHGKALLTNILHGNFTFPIDIFPISKLTKRNKDGECIPFFNYHPDVIKDLLAKNGFKVLETRSVSNVRSPILKKYLPIDLLMWLEKILQKPLSFVNFGPSIFILARKKS